ncbi:MAG: hypothetical protein GWP69_21275 [Gammaproteobacteria bacterium]|jgi:hypothetical protein|nr:hypothetical protein [Gammaproteobacteria bacterium]
MSNVDKGSQIFKKAVTIIASLGAIVIGLLLIIAIVVLSLNQDVIYSTIIVEHYPATFGLPLAAVGALVLVFILEYASGPIEFQGLGFSFKGASGPLVLWVFVYLVMVSTIVLVWDKKASSEVISEMLKEKLKTAVLKENHRRCRIEKGHYKKYSADEISVICALELAKTLSENEPEQTQ